MTDTTSRKPETAVSLPAHPGRRILHRAWPRLAGAATVAMTVAACSSWSGLTGGGTPAPDAATAPPDGSFTSRVRSFFSGSGSLNSGTPADLNCPVVEYRQGAATWAVNGQGQVIADGGENSSIKMDLRHQASFVQTARECIVSGANLIIKVGVQGRLVLGPAGSPGSTVNIPLRYALVREGPHPKTLWTKLFTVQVTASELNMQWIHVQEEMTIPRPPPQELDAYVIYVGFDPGGGAKAPPRVPSKGRGGHGA